VKLIACCFLVALAISRHRLGTVPVDELSDVPIGKQQPPANAHVADVTISHETPNRPLCAGKPLRGLTHIVKLIRWCLGLDCCL
jgi:hypothetical protein